VLTLSLLAGCATKSREPVLSPAQREANVQSFDHVWTTVRDKHFDPALNGVDWDAARSEFRPQVEQAETMSAARAVMDAMIQRLGQSHFGIIPAQVYTEMQKWETGGGAGVTGIEPCVVEGQALVWRVRPDSPAARAGVRPGWSIVAVGDRKVADVVARVGEAFNASTLRELLLNRAVRDGMKGEVGQTLAIEFLDGDDREAKCVLELTLPEGKLARIGNLPATHLRFESQQLDGNIGYVTFNIWLDPADLMPRLQRAVAEFKDVHGVILDLRGNPGGIGGMAMGVAGMFVDQSGRQLGTMSTRETNLNFIVIPRAEVYRGPLAILIDGSSASTTEIFAGGMKDLARARLFGTRTAGAALPSIIERLPNGDGFQYAFANYVSAGGQPLEGQGVSPDVEVALSRRALLDGHDPVIDAATAWIQEQRRSGATTTETTGRVDDVPSTVRFTRNEWRTR
jgi:carboxyl-terminal processing protease